MASNYSVICERPPLDEHLPFLTRNTSYFILKSITNFKLFSPLKTDNFTHLLI